MTTNPSAVHLISEKYRRLVFIYGNDTILAVLSTFFAHITGSRGFDLHLCRRCVAIHTALVKPNVEQSPYDIALIENLCDSYLDCLGDHIGYLIRTYEEESHGQKEREGK